MNTIDFKNFSPIIAGTLAVATVGYFGYSAITFFAEKCIKAEIINSVAQNAIDFEIQKAASENIINEKNFAVTKFQAAIRGNIVGLQFQKLKNRDLLLKKNSRTIKFQCFIRSFNAKLDAEKARKNLLSYSFIEKAKPYLDEPSNRKDLPKNESGKTQVYFPKELPIVLKQSGSPANQKRHEQMEQAREICERNNYVNLIIPKARVYGDFIVENKLPLTNDGTKEQIGLYIENRDKFTNAVKHFTGFLCQCTLDDITGNCSGNPYSKISKTPIGRYDNIPLYLEGEKGMIGLIDLEEFKPLCNKKSKYWCYYKCITAINLFPYHLEEIISEAKKFDSEIEKLIGNLESERDKTLVFFNLLYVSHLEFIQTRGISLDNPEKTVELSNERREQIKWVIEKELYKENEDNWYRGILGEDPKNVVNSFNEKVFPYIFNEACTLIKDLLKENLNAQEERLSCLTFSDLLAVRTLKFTRDNASYLKFRNAIVNKIDMLKFKSYEDAKGFVQELLIIILKEMEGKEISYFNSRFEGRCYYGMCIHC